MGRTRRPTPQVRFEQTPLHAPVPGLRKATPPPSAAVKNPMSRAGAITVRQRHHRGSTFAYLALAARHNLYAHGCYAPR